MSEKTKYRLFISAEVDHGDGNVEDLRDPRKAPVYEFEDEDQAALATEKLNAYAFQLTQPELLDPERLSPAEYWLVNSEVLHAYEQDGISLQEMKADCQKALDDPKAYGEGPGQDGEHLQEARRLFLKALTPNAEYIGPSL